MIHTEDPQVRKQYEAAVTSFIERAKQDKRVLGIILNGSMAYDEVTDRSNINMYIITDAGHYRSVRLIERGVPIDVEIYSRDGFMRRIQSQRGVGVLQTLSYSKLVFSRDCSLTDFYKGLTKKVGNRDREYLQIIYHQAVLYDLSKAEKYLYIKKDVAHGFHFFIHGVSELGYLLCYLNDVFPPREVIIRGREFEPELFTQLYDDLISNEVTEESLDFVLRKAYEYMDSLDLDIYKPILDYISGNGGTATQTELGVHFGPRGLRLEGFDIENLHRRKILRRTITPVKLTKKGVVEYNEAQYHFSWDSFDASKVIPTRVGPAPVERERVQADYQNAIDNLTARAQSDEYVLSMMLAGSLSYDIVWEKSDVDTIIVTKDEPFRNFRGFVEKDVWIDVFVLPRDTFRKLAQRVTDGSVFHSFFSKSRLLFTRDDTIHDLYEDINSVGSRDLENLVLLNYIFCKDLINKAWKALHVKDDPAFSVHFLRSGIARLANIEVLLNRRIPLRESTVQALELNPPLFNKIFTEMIVNSTKDKLPLVDVLNTMEAYLDERLETIAEPILRLLEQKQEVTHSDLMAEFSAIRLPIDMREFVKKGLVVQTEAPLRFTKKSTAEVMQPAYHPVRSSEDVMPMM